MKTTKRKGLILTLFFITGLSALNLEHHMYLGLRTPDIWQTYDPPFAESLKRPIGPYGSASVAAMMTLKFYLIGLILPDLFIPAQQGIVRAIIKELYKERHNLGGPLLIKDWTYNNILDSFVFTAPEPNANLPALRAMVEYAKKRRWTAYEKSLIYGAYVHVIQDLYSGTSLMPTRFGYGYAVESESALTNGFFVIILLYGKEE
jgi:hypothetical protein